MRRGRQALRFHGAQGQYPRTSRSAALQGILGRPRKEFFSVMTRIGYTVMGQKVLNLEQDLRFTATGLTAALSTK